MTKVLREKTFALAAAIFDGPNKKRVEISMKLAYNQFIKVLLIKLHFMCVPFILSFTLYGTHIYVRRRKFQGQSISLVKR